MDLKKKVKAYSTLPAQVFYDLRELTGNISGNDLHELFRIVCGEPSPSGRKVVRFRENENRLNALGLAFESELMDENLLEAIDEYPPLRHSLARAYAANGFPREAEYAAKHEITDTLQMPEWAAKNLMKYDYAF